MRKLVALAILVVTLALAGTAGAGKIRTSADGDGGGTPACCSFWIVAVYTYVNGYPQYWYCRYASDGNIVWQLDCWS